MAGFDLAALKERASTVNAGFTKGQKALMIGGTLAVVVGLVVFTKLAGGTDYATLYANLEPGDAAAVTERLDADGVSYELADGGGTIRVPRDVLYETRMQLSADGVASGGQEGWSILDGQGITASEFSQRVGYQRALEGELARTIRSIEGVESATVHLALPRDTAFALDDTEASASVLISTRGGTTLDSMQVQAIVNLVASSVDKLEPSDVTVADSSGMVLAAPGQRSVDYAGNDLNMRQAAAFEERVAADIRSMLTSVLGPNNAVVSVSAELDFDEATITRETYTQPLTDPAGNPLPLTESNRTETYTGEGTGAAGVLGAEDGGGEAGGAATEYNLDESDRTNAVDREVESINRAPGTIERLGIAVIVDEASTTPAMMAEIEQLVTAGADIRADRGDTLAVSRLPFDTSIQDTMADEAEAAEADAAAQARNDLYQTIGLGLLVGLVLLVSWLKMRKAAKRRRQAQAIEARAIEAALVPAGLTVGEATSALTQPAPADIDLAPVDALDLDAFDEAPAFPLGGDDPASRVASDVADMIDNQPDEVAQLLRGWLGDRRAGGR
ncbi:flagellar basal-body MS-ring/collar protein FliF [Actinomarinicola tropica]|uniref:Flagellar M-ring protein n=1 Tax=Actinomarinicola tropica TaxID=2789776 RepID=A0A5Q2RG13_9ACTN|nr:flagellar basal-body MS-ring/collar protein FliF [Actinomarinicola tropica]QGG94643.1 flagellar M-ring protein FliF [Actinomarinicola tropica]